MLLENQIIFVKWNPKNKKYYEDLGYIFTKKGEAFQVDIKDLSKGSKAMVKVQCDYCKKIVNKTYGTYLKQHHEEFGDACSGCQTKKNKVISREKYSVDNVFQLEETKEKIKKHFYDIYGVDNPSQVNEIYDKIKRTWKKKYGKDHISQVSSIQEKKKENNLKKYGVTNPSKLKIVQEKIENTTMERYGYKRASQHPDIKEKVTKTCMERYGKKRYSMTDECKEKIKNTNLKKYGTQQVLENPEIREKILFTLKEKNRIPVSKPQLQLYELLKKYYKNCELNYLEGHCFLDCFVLIDNIKIDIEYDGFYWHKDKKNKDRKRDEFLKSKGYKILRITGTNKIPSIEDIQLKIKSLCQTNKKFERINMV